MTTPPRRASRFHRVGPLFLLFGCFAAHPAGAVAQDAAASTTGTVIGHVYCADTQKPARFAQVRLVPIPRATPASSPRAAMSERFTGGNGMSATDVDGSFTMMNVQPGEYYVDVTNPGYMQPTRGAMNTTQLTSAMRDKLNGVATRISVAANQATNAQVTIYRGAVLTGTLLYDDGSPASGVQVAAMVLDDAQASGGGSSSGTAVNFRQVTYERTGDRGQFRLIGLPDGSYTVVARPVGFRGPAMIPIFYGNTLHRAEAKRVDVKAGDERGGLDIQIPASTLRIVSGTVQSAEDGHGLGRTTVSMTLTGEGGDSVNVMSAPDGSFHFNSVQDGRFSVSANGSPSIDIEVKAGDVTGLVVNVPEANAPAE